jgi:hypothetical protein
MHAVSYLYHNPEDGDTIYIGLNPNNPNAERLVGLVAGAPCHLTGFRRLVGTLSLREETE